MDLTNNENPFDPTPKLKSSPVPILFIPFDGDEDDCSYCGNEYSVTFLFKQKYCRNCLFLYINNTTDDNTYLDVHISTNNTQCSEHKTSRNSDFYTQNIQEWCEYCSEISYFKQIVPFLPCEQSKSKRVKDLNLIDCKLCGELIYQQISNFLMCRFCSNCYLISSGWTESTLVKEPISILYLPWWDNYNACIGCNYGHYLKFISDCQKWCSNCFVIYTGCRYCLTTTITFGITDKSRCLKCKRNFFISINITPFISGNNVVDEFLASTRIFYHQISDYMNNFDKNSNLLNVYNYTKMCDSCYFDDLKLFMRWIPYSEITNLVKIAEGGFSIIYKATWLKKYFTGGKQHDTIAIKRFSNSQDISKYFLNELKSLYQCYNVDRIIRCYGITKDPEKGEYMMIMDYATGGNLHNYLQKDFANIIWKNKLHNLWKISDGLYTIHKKNFIHRDFHSGNILFGGGWQIGDLGLSQPANITSLNNEIYGVIPYIAPEVFNGATFSKESDIYSMGMIMWEHTTGCKPFANVDHDTHLIYKIIDGKRPEMTNDTPECFANLMKRCWDSNPTKRPSAKEICETFYDWSFIEKDVEQFNQAEKKRLELIESKQLGPEFAEKSHPGAIYTSRALSSLISKSSSINSFSTNSFNIKEDNKPEIKESNDKEYISKEIDLDINDIQSSSLQNTIQNTQYQNPSRPSNILIHSTINVSRKRNFDELKTGKAQDNGKHAKI